MIKRVKGLTEKLSTGEVMVWKGPETWYLYSNSELADSSRRASGMNIEEARAYSAKHSFSQHLDVVP